ncbi:hypothetical protein HAX54_046272 [Datura stramonium]|uniref:RRM domain-containing protein n=1 Tax=Datura stramonium TaxID=4076 RepID=A0ABS8WLK1_DATST|nr:hypothetical protein [Datura stramonium]
MDENEAAEGGVFGDGVGAPMEQFHRNEAISAVADDGFLGEEDDDYEDLYNDVNVGENFLQSFRKNEEAEKAVELVSPLPESGSAAVLAAVGEVKGEKEENVVSRISGRVDGFRDLPVGGNEMGDRDLVPAARSGICAAGGVKVESCDPSGKVADLEKNASNNVVNREIIQRPTAAGAGVLGNAGNVGNSGNDNMVRQGMVNGNTTGNSIHNFGVLGGGGPSGGGGGGGTVLFVGDLHWWTTDAELEVELSKYGAVKEVKFFDEKASGKSKGYCQAEFHEPAAATACKEGMNGHVFNGRACVVAFASPYTVKRMGEAQVNRNQQNAQSQTAPVNAQARRGPGDIAGKPGGNNNNDATVGNFQGGGDNNRGIGRGNWGRGGPQGMGNWGPVGPMRNRPGGIVGRGLMGNGGGGFGQGIGAAPPLIHPQTMMGQCFDPAFGGPMGRMGGYGGFPVGPTPPFSGMLPSFPPVGGVGLPGVAPHVNPAFFGRRMPMNGMGMMPRAGMERPNMGMWSDPNMGGWAGDEHGYRTGESNYGEEAVSDHQYGEENRDKGAWPSNKEKDRASERDRSGSSDKRYRDDREPSYDRDIARDKNTGLDHDWQERRRQDDRDVRREKERACSRDRDHDLDRNRDSERERGRHRDDRDRYADRHRYRDREQEYDDELDRGRSSRTQAKSRLLREDDSRSRSKDADYEKRRRLTSD